MSELPYIREYSDLPKQELRQLSFKRRFKASHPLWDDSMILLRDLTARIIPLHSTVLDVGCGHGNFILDELPHHFGEKIGLDIDSDVAAHNKSIDRVLYGDTDLIPLADHSIDFILSLWVMEHVSDPDKAFEEMFRVLRPGGHMAFVTPNAHALIVRTRALLPYRYAKKIVRTLYGRAEEDTFDIQYKANTMKRIKSLAQKHGFSILHLAENADPSYTSFESISYHVSAFLSNLPCSLFKPHLIAFLQKSK